MQPRSSNRQDALRPSFEAQNFVRERLLRAWLRSLGAQRGDGAPRASNKWLTRRARADCVMAPPTCTRRGDEAARQYAASTTTNCKI